MKKEWFIAFLIGMMMISGCSHKNETGNYQTIDAKQAKEMMNDQDVIILDVRTQEEYDEKHIPNAILLPLHTIIDKAESVLLDKHATILVYCRSGNRSQQAAAILADLGYQNVYDFGDIKDWPYEIEGAL